MNVDIVQYIDKPIFFINRIDDDTFSINLGNYSNQLNESNQCVSLKLLNCIIVVLFS